jgi:hypothetical protein
MYIYYCVFIHAIAVQYNPTVLGKKSINNIKYHANISVSIGFSLGASSAHGEIDISASRLVN